MSQPPGTGESWQRPPADLSLPPGEVHVWRIFLDQALPAHQHEFAALLSEDEAARAARFRFERDRRRFITARAAFRTILARYQGFEPQALRFDYNAYGKPSLKAEFGGHALGINMAHSQDLALCAVVRGRELGIDLEQVRALADMEAIAQRFFSPSECAALKSLPEGEKCEAFYNCWTRKEAFIKACGEGLSMPLDSFEVTLAPGEAAKLLSVEGDPQKAALWSLAALTPADGYAAALVVEGNSDWRLACWQWTA